MGSVWFLLGLKGRINRARYIAVQLALITVWFMVWLNPLHLSSQWEALSWVVTIAVLWINTVTTVKRLHDRNRSGWWAVAVFIVNRLSYVYYGLFLGNYFGVDISAAEQLLLVLFAVALSLLQTWIIIELFFMIGTDGANRFGLDPTRTAADFPVDSRPGPAGVPDFLKRRVDPA